MLEQCAFHQCMPLQRAWTAQGPGGCQEGQSLPAETDTHQEVNSLQRWRGGINRVEDRRMMAVGQGGGLDQAQEECGIGSAGVHHIQMPFPDLVCLYRSTQTWGSHIAGTGLS